MKKSLLLVVILLITMLPTAAAQEQQTPEQLCEAAAPNAERLEDNQFEQPEQVIEAGVDYHAIFCTGAGAIYIDLFEDYAPITVNSFIFLAQQGFYNDTNFHRVIADFMAQGGDPTNTGGSGPGYNFKDEFVGFVRFEEPGYLAMANAGPGTNGSQFFITTAPTTHLYMGHSIFGYVLEGQENVEAIELRDPNTAVAPGTSLDTVLIVTDPSTVQTTYTEPEPAAQEEVAAIFAAIGENVSMLTQTPILSVDDNAPAIMSTDETVSAAPESLQEEYRSLLEGHNHQYQISETVINASCDLNALPIAEMTYTMDAYASQEDARAALQENFIARQAEEMGLEETDPETEGALLYSMFTADQRDERCDADVKVAMTTWQRGHYVITAIIKYQEVENIFPAEDLLTQTVGALVFESFLQDVLIIEAH